MRCIAFHRPWTVCSAVFAQEGFHPGEVVVDGIEIGAVGRKEEKFRDRFLHHLPSRAAQCIWLERLSVHHRLSGAQLGKMQLISNNSPNQIVVQKICQLHFVPRTGYNGIAL